MPHGRSWQIANQVRRVLLFYTVCWTTFLLSSTFNNHP
jgi:hypothetical protein